MSFWDKITDYWKENIRNNIKMISATFGNMISVLIATILFVVREGYDFTVALIIVILSLQPFFYWYINVIFKGETAIKDQEILMLTRELDFNREITEYRVLLAAKEGKVPEIIESTHDWNELNRKIAELQEEIKILKS